jgi:hypothetical protein
MPSFVWNRDFDEAYANPYEYATQKQFVREAEAILTEVRKGLQQFDFHFTVSDVSVKKAIWIIYNDAIDALSEALNLLKKKRHKLVGRIFRDVWEAAQLADYFLHTHPTGFLKKVLEQFV